MFSLVLGIYLFYQFTVPLSKNNKIVIFKIKEGETVNDIAINLKKQGILRNIFAFKLTARVYDPQDFRAGKYRLNTGYTLYNILRILTSKPNMNDDLIITIIDGWTREDIADYLNQQNIVSRDEFLQYTVSIKKFKKDFPDLFEGVPDDSSLEGFLFPDTYYISKNAKLKEIVYKMLNNFKRKIAQINLQNSEIDIYGKYDRYDRYDLIIMASIIEKEVVKYKEKRMVADILYKRLDKGMKLQVDASINYILKKNTPRLTYDDISVDNPYNTYKYNGLPPGPICNPGLSSLKAVIDPIENDYYFFLTSKSGNAYFAETLSKHKKNRRYLDL
jgi:UPF0755 protein